MCQGPLRAAIAAVGKGNFYSAVGEWLVSHIASDQFIVVRYALEGAPEFIVNDVLPEAVADLYIAGAYRFDPLLRLWKANQNPTCAVIRQLDHDTEVRENYLEAIFRRCFIQDELAILVPAPTKVCVAFCLEKDSGEYSAADLSAAKELLPMVAELVRLHIEVSLLRSAAGAGPAAYDQFHVPLAVIDRKSRVVYANEAWKRHHISRNVEGHLPADMLSIQPGESIIDKKWRLIWNALDTHFPIAPSGILVAAHPLTVAEKDEGFASAFERFVKRHMLTQREKEVARLALFGSSNAHAARQLGLSVGSIRNHRSNIYSKLDVTTEREFFRLFLVEVFIKPQ